ncbi:MAG: branched-chain amino acid transaminase [Gammaproteobacteria bacterium]|jgi:branched-chain amino acid aminotransferase|nr:branched-chain amino acid transaminase [Gammaproteobacteria bacterium]
MQFIWKNGALMPSENAQTHVLTHSLHYGSAVFEGLRFYETDDGPVIFKLKEHIERLFYSAHQLEMKIPYTVDQLCQACIDTISHNNIQAGYIRPLAYFGHGPLKVVPHPELPADVIVAVWPWGDYLGVKLVDVVTSQYIRIHPSSSVVNAKISGHYVNSMLAGLAIRGTKYHEALMLDADGYVAEGSAENIFIVKDNKIITPPTGTILEGITRKTVMDMAAMCGIPVEERKFRREEILTADEAFFSGTAVEITPIRSLDDTLIGGGQMGPISEKIQGLYQEVVSGKVPSFHHTLTRVESAVLTA